MLFSNKQESCFVELYVKTTPLIPVHSPLPGLLSTSPLCQDSSPPSWSPCPCSHTTAIIFVGAVPLVT